MFSEGTVDEIVALVQRNELKLGPTVHGHDHWFVVAEASIAAEFSLCFT
jgi:hypothetical protein